MRILIVEDEFLVAVQLEEDIRSAGCTVVGPYSTLARAVEASRRERFDVALLDVNLNGDMVYPLADELLARRIPFVLLSGYSSSDLPERLSDVPRATKPYDPATLIEILQTAVS